MTKIIFGPDQAAVAAKVLDVDACGSVHVHPVAPLDDDRSVVGELLEPEVTQLGVVLHAVQIDVGELHAARVDAHELEGGARDVGLRAGALSDSADEGGLARAKLTREE